MSTNQEQPYLGGPLPQADVEEALKPAAEVFKGLFRKNKRKNTK